MNLQFAGVLDQSELPELAGVEGWCENPCGAVWLTRPTLAIFQTSAGSRDAKGRE